MKDKDLYLPGGAKAIEDGCLCPLEQPMAYRGYYIVYLGCPIHGKDAQSGGSILPSNIYVWVYYEDKDEKA